MRRTPQELPQYLRIVDSNAAVSATILEVAASHSFVRLMYLFGRTGRGLVGGDLLIDTASSCSVVADHASAASVEEAMRIAGASKDNSIDMIVGCGGGRVLDVAKYAAFQAKKPFLSVPTQATHDGICSPSPFSRTRTGSPQPWRRAADRNRRAGARRRAITARMPRQRRRRPCIEHPGCRRLEMGAAVRGGGVRRLRSAARRDGRAADACPPSLARPRVSPLRARKSSCSFEASC